MRPSGINEEYLRELYAKFSADILNADDEVLSELEHTIANLKLRRDALLC